MHIKQLHKRYNYKSVFAGHGRVSLKTFARNVAHVGGPEGEEIRRWLAIKGIKA